MFSSDDRFVVLNGRSRLSDRSFSHERPLHQKADVGRNLTKVRSADEAAVRCRAALKDWLNVCSADETAIPMGVGQVVKFATRIRFFSAGAASVWRSEDRLRFPFESIPANVTRPHWRQILELTDQPSHVIFCIGDIDSKRVEPIF